MTLLDRLLAPWIFVVTGIIFNILSAVLTHYFIGLNNDQINTLDRNIANKQVLIDSLWQSKNELERKKEFFILFLASQAESNSPLVDYYRDYIETLAEDYDLEGFDKQLNKIDFTRPVLLVELSNAAQRSVIESINNTYFESLELNESKMPLEKNNARLFSIAIFLQLIGLILVLAKDLRRPQGTSD